MEQYITNQSVMHGTTITSLICSVTCTSCGFWKVGI